MPVYIAKGIGLSFEILGKFLRFYPFIFKETGRPAFSRSTVSWMAKNTLFCDTSKARKELGYRPQYSIEDGIRETVEWYKEIGAL